MNIQYFALSTSEASQKHLPSPRDIKGCISLMAGTYLISTMFRLFWPGVFAHTGISDPLSPANTAIQLVGIA